MLNMTTQSLRSKVGLLCRAWRMMTLVVGLCLITVVMSVPVVRAGSKAGPFDGLPGRWVGDGRLGFKSGNVENIKCRATYFVENDGQNLRQNIRCASASGKVELKSEIVHAADGTLTGTWQELLYDLSGRLTGTVTKRGFRLAVKGDALNANMEIIVKDDRQIVEMHFDSEMLIGMTLLLKKG